MKIPISQIQIPERFRIEYGDLTGLKDSISTHGLIAPVLVDITNGVPTLVAGMRRLLAHQQLDETEIEVVTREGMSELERRELEYEENKRRKDFTWPEEVRALAAIADLRRSSGMATTLSSMSEDLDASLGKLSEDLALSEAMKVYPELEKEKSRDAAVKKMRRLKDEEWRAALAAVTEHKSDRCVLHHADSREVLASMETDSIDLIITDPPWGVSYDENPQAQETGLKLFDDSNLSAFKLLTDLLPDLWRVLKPEAHAYFFFATRFYSQTFSLLSHRFDVHPIPLVWVKPGGYNLSPLGRFTPNYETIFWCRKGVRGMERASLATFSYPAPSDRVHPAQKPTDLLRELVQISSREGEVVLDPFGGSGATGVAALREGRKVVLVEQVKVYFDALKIAVTNELGGGEK